MEVILPVLPFYHIIFPEGVKRGVHNVIQCSIISIKYKEILWVEARSKARTEGVTNRLANLKSPISFAGFLQLTLKFVLSALFSITASDK